MESEADRSKNENFGDPSSSSSNGSSSCFECNICFEMAEDPILTLCGHLYCWPCLYKWLHAQASSHRCPVCNASIEEEQLVPIYGRGKSPSNSGPQSASTNDIPRRPTGRRPETASVPDHDANRYPQQGSGLIGGVFPMEAMRMGSLTLSAAFGGIFPAVFPFIFPAMMHFQVHGFNDAAVYGMTSGFRYGVYNPFHGGNDRGFHEVVRRGQLMDSSLLKIWFLLIGLAVIFYLIC